MHRIMLNFEKNRIKNLCLIGLMGSGKSVIGKDLSKKLNIDFIDTDNEIERELGLSIDLIFKNHGEDYFRKVEEEICLNHLNSRETIISLGGGSVINPKIRETIKKNSYSIYLKVDISVLVNRLVNTKKRPLLKTINKKQILNNLFNKRKTYYNNADLIVENNSDKKEVVSKIMNKLKQL